jgi:hypothetical protein
VRVLRVFGSSPPPSSHHLIISSHLLEGLRMTAAD